MPFFLLFVEYYSHLFPEKDVFVIWRDRCGSAQIEKGRVECKDFISCHKCYSFSTKVQKTA